jgi:hypothetical protein
LIAMPAKSGAPSFIDLCTARWPDKAARLADGFYAIKDKEGRIIPFRANTDQAQFLAERHGFDLILKARQKGFTTVIQLDMLDDCLFMPNIAAGIVAHTREDAEAFFADKIRFAYDALPPEFRKLVVAERDSSRSLKFSNGSSIRVGTSLRSGTFQRLHVSEYGKLCAKWPEKAREVRSGAFNTVQAGQRITVESTAEGHSGHFFDMCKGAQDRQKQGIVPTPLDFKFHFAPWFTSPEYALAQDVGETAEQRDYFEKLAADHGIVLTRQQRGWHVRKSEQQGDDMLREFPSTPDEAFAASVEGAYLVRQMARMRTDGRICRIPVLDAPVYTTWDLGLNDSMCIVFWQDVGMERRAVDYLEDSGEGFGYYARRLAEKGYNYSRHYMPHDAEQRRLGVVAKTARESAEEAGIRPVEVLPRIASERDGIEASRAYLAQVWIDQERCDRLIRCLDNYRKDWDPKLGVFREHPRHDEYSHGYKSFETAAIRPRPAPAARARKTDTRWVI